MDIIENGAVNPGLKAVIFAGSSYLTEDGTKKILRKGGRELLTDKAFEKIRGRYVIENTLDSLLALGLSDISVVALDRNLELIAGKYRFNGISQKGATTLHANMLNAKNSLSLSPGEMVYAVYGDHLFTTWEDHAYFLSRAGTLIGKADLIHAAASADTAGFFEGYYPEEYVHTRDISFRGTGMSLIRPDAVDLSVTKFGYLVRKLENPDVMAGLFVQIWKRAKYQKADITRDVLFMFGAKYMSRLYRKTGEKAWQKLRDSCRKHVSLQALESYSSALFDARVRILPHPMFSTSMDLDWKDERQLFEREYDAITERITKARSFVRNVGVPDIYTPKGCSYIRDFYDDSRFPSVEQALRN